MAMEKSGQQEIREWLNGLDPDKREWAITCMTSAAEGGIGYLQLDSTTYGALLHDGIATIVDLKQRMAEGTLESIRGIGPRRVHRITSAVAAYEGTREDNA